ncbi:MAG: hypothetical protein WKG07_27250 [Hymenobacter sp.]
MTQSLSGKASLLTGQSVSAAPARRERAGRCRRCRSLPLTLARFTVRWCCPRACSMAKCSSQTDDGSLSFAVEDYKRPTFPGDARLGARPAAAGRAAYGTG